MIEVKHLDKSFGDLHILKDISTNIEKGEKVVIIGPSGSGKSTFLRCLNRLEQPSDGQIFFEGEDLTHMPDRQLYSVRQKMGMVFQHFHLFPHLTIQKNITLAPVKLKRMTQAEADAKATELLQKVGLADKANQYPDQLSGGQKQRIAIAGIIAMRPKTIVFDEPTAMLDPDGHAEVTSTMLRLNKEEGLTVVNITHFMEEAVLADRVVVMDDGDIVMEGTPREIFTQVEALRALHLDVPQVTEIAVRLHEKYPFIPRDVLTIDEMVDVLCH